jgi:hypothetical protein
MTDTKNLSTTPLESDPLVEPFVLPVVYTPDEVNNTVWKVKRSKEMAKPLLLCMGIILIPAGLALTIFFNMTPQGGTELMLFWVGSLVAFVLVAAAIPSLIAWIIFSSCKRKALRTYDTDSRFHSPVIYTIGAKGFQIQYTNSIMLKDWRYVTDCIELPDSLCFIVEGGLFPIPKRFFHSKAQVDSICRLAIDNASTFSKIGKPRTDIIFQPASQNCTLAVVAESDTADQDQEQAEQLESAGLTLAPQHPQSSLISEPIVFHQKSQTLMLECDYTIEELKRADNLLFRQFHLPLLIARYIVITLFAPSLFIVTTAPIDWTLHWDLYPVVLPYTPLLIPFFALHAKIVFDKRIEKLKETIKHDAPLQIELTHTACRVRARRYFMDLDWNKFIQCLVTTEFYICIASGYSAIIPRRLLCDKTKADFVEKLLRENIDKYVDQTA